MEQKMQTNIVTIRRIGWQSRTYNVEYGGITSCYPSVETVPWKKILELIDYDIDRIDWPYAARDRNWIREKLKNPDYCGVSNLIGRMILKQIQKKGK